MIQLSGDTQDVPTMTWSGSLGFADELPTDLAAEEVAVIGPDLAGAIDEEGYINLPAHEVVDEMAKIGRASCRERV